MNMNIVLLSFKGITQDMCTKNIPKHPGHRGMLQVGSCCTPHPNRDSCYLQFLDSSTLIWPQSSVCKHASFRLKVRSGKDCGLGPTPRNPGLTSVRSCCPKKGIPMHPTTTTLTTLCLKKQHCFAISRLPSWQAFSLFFFDTYGASNFHLHEC